MYFCSAVTVDIMCVVDFSAHAGYLFSNTSRVIMIQS